jgi:hypothetical protein
MVISIRSCSENQSMNDQTIGPPGRWQFDGRCVAGVMIGRWRQSWANFGIGTREQDRFGLNHLASVQAWRPKRESCSAPGVLE